MRKRFFPSIPLLRKLRKRLARKVHPIGAANGRGQPRIAVGAIMKNEGPYILEWIAYHRVLGIDRFFIADDSSDDGLTEILSKLSSAGIVDFFPAVRQPDKPPLFPAYQEILRRHSGDADWIVFIDGDEFLLPTDGARSLVPFFDAMNAKVRVGAVVLNWAAYGSSGHENGSPEPVIERFSRRGEEGWIVNHHYKSAVRTTASPRTRATPHLLGTAPGLKTVDTTGTRLKNHPEKGEGLSEKVTWDRVRVNHYIVKSRAEFFAKKSARGMVTRSYALKGERYFTGHDRNEVLDPMPQWLVDATKAEMERLKVLCG